MEALRIHRLIFVLVLVFSLGCTKKTPPATGSSSEKTVDTNAEAQAADSSWILAVARDNSALLQLAQSSSGWGAFFGNNLVKAVALFQKDARSNEDARIGGARAALRLARAYGNLARLQEALVEPFHTAQSARPGAEKTAAWRRYVEGRLAQRVGNITKARSILENVKAPGLSSLARAAVAIPDDGGSAGPLADLLAGRVGGADAEMPDGISEHYFNRLRVRSLASARRSRLAMKIWDRLDNRSPDLVVTKAAKEDKMWDPLAAEAGQRLYAAVALEMLKGAEGWAALHEARAYLHLGLAGAAITAIDGLLATPPKTASLATLVLSGAAGPSDLIGHATALKIECLVAIGKIEEAKLLLSEMGQATIAQRVRRATAQSMLGVSITDAFPSDRGELTTLVNSRVAALGKSAKGVTDVTELALVERFVDELQREWADVLAKNDKPARAARERTMAEDKANAFAVSARNSVASLLASSLAALKIGQYRVSLKYLSRLKENFPAAYGASEQLRDILSYRAMAREGGATTGQ